MSGAEFLCRCNCHRGAAGAHRGGCPCATIGPSSCLVCRQGLHAHDVMAGGELVCDEIRQRRRDEHRRRTAATTAVARAYADVHRSAWAAARAQRVAAGAEPPRYVAAVTTDAEAAAAAARIRARMRQRQETG